MPRTVYRFGDCQIDPSSRELRRGGELVELSPKVFDCLAYLVERRDRAVGRDELVAAVWGKTEITDTLLGQTILKARRAVGDSARDQGVIRTIPRFGYAWAADVTTDAVIDAVDDTPPLAPRPPRRAAAVAAIVLAAIVAIGVIAWLLAERRPTPRPTRAAVVLPVDVMAGSEWAWVRLGLMDAIAARLREGGLAVVPSDTVVALTDAGRFDVGAATGAALTVAPSAVWGPGGWHVRVEVQGAGSPLAINIESSDVLLAGRIASDAVLAQLGKAPPTAPESPELDDAGRLQRAEAALLAGDIAGARRLLLSAPDTVVQSPEYVLRLAKLDFREGRFDEAERRLRELSARATAETDAVLRARIRNGLGHVALRRGDAAAAAAAYDEAATLLRGHDAPEVLGQAYMGRGSAAQIRGDAESARRDLSQARIAFELAGDEMSTARVDANEGMLDMSGERYPSAAGALDRAAQRFERFGMANELAMTASAQIAAQLALLRPREALAAGARAWPLRERASDAGIRHALATNRARALEANGQRDEAQALLDEVIAAADPAREGLVLAYARYVAARVALGAGRAQAAADFAEAATADLDERSSARDRAAVWLARARALRVAGHVKAASDAVVRLSAIAQSDATPTTQLYAGLARAEQQIAEAQLAAGRGEYDRALALAEQTGVPVDIAEVAVSYATHLIDAGELERARAVVGRTARWADEDFACAVLQARLYAALGQPQAWQHALTVARRLAGEREIPAAATQLAAGTAGLH